MASPERLTRRLVARVGSTLVALPALRQDALLYLAAAVFSGGVALFAITADYRQWGELSLVPYLAAAALCEGAFQLRRRRGKQAPRHRSELDSGAPVSGLRRGIVIGVFALAVVVPLGIQVTARADATSTVTNPHGALAQPEVAVIERAGDRFDHFEDPYLSDPTTVGLSPSNDDKKVNDTSYFPYLPGMVFFGMANDGPVPKELGDARVVLAGFTLLVVVLGLFLVPASERRRWRAFQFLLVLPTGALPVVTGGDDLPVLGLMLLGLVFIRRRQPVLAGVAMALAGVLKWTAWPLILLCVLCVRDDEDRPAVLRYSLSVACIVLPICGAGVALGPHAFFENVIMFPLGLTKVHSPAASPLPGQLLVQLLPAYKKVLTVGLIAAGALAVLVMLYRHPPRTAYEAAHFAGWALAFATVIAPATRFGYFIYPVNMVVWAYLLHELPADAEPGETLAAAYTGTGPVEGDRPQLASSTW